MCKICYKNISKEKGDKLRGLFTSIKGHPCLTKGHLDYPER